MSIVEMICHAANQSLDGAQSLPFSAYTDPTLLLAEQADIFAKEWVFVCMEGEIPNPGNYFAMNLAGEPIIVMRGDDGDLLALSNICRHRGTVLLDEGFGSIDKYIICPYHAWSYEKSGALRAVPFTKQIPVVSSEHHLLEFKLSSWNGLVFVNLDAKSEPFTQRIQGIDQYLEFFQPETFDHVSAGEPESWQANWKLVIENAIESYHLFKVHETTLEKYSPTRNAYYIAGCSEWTLTGGKSERSKGFLERLFGRSYGEGYDHYILISTPPSFVGILSYGSLGWLSAHPIDTHSTQIRTGVIGLDDNALDSESHEFAAAFLREDQNICERVQKGMQSKLARGGKLVDMERVVVDFHRFVGSRLGGTPPSTFFQDEAGSQWWKTNN